MVNIIIKCRCLKVKLTHLTDLGQIFRMTYASDIYPTKRTGNQNNP